MVERSNAMWANLSHVQRAVVLGPVAVGLALGLTACENEGDAGETSQTSAFSPPPSESEGQNQMLPPNPEDLTPPVVPTPKESLNPLPSGIDTIPPLHFEIVGKCPSKEGLTNKSSGFTPGGIVQHIINRPDGTAYEGLVDGGLGTIDEKGRSNWKWECDPKDPAGHYEGYIIDFGPNKKFDGALVGDDRTISYSFDIPGSKATRRT